MAAEARCRVHRGASRGGNFAGGSRRARRSEPVSFCARLLAIVRRASASLPYGPPNGSRQEPVAEAGAVSDADRRPDWFSRNEFVYEGISQIHRAYADRISPSPGGLTSQARNEIHARSGGEGDCLQISRHLKSYRFSVAERAARAAAGRR